MNFSEEARRLASGYRRPSMISSEPPGERWPTTIPLDRKRNVPILGMTDEELTRAHDQAARRAERTDHGSDDRVRYESQVRAVERELERRSQQAEVDDLVEQMDQDEDGPADEHHSAPPQIQSDFS